MYAIRSYYGYQRKSEGGGERTETEPADHAPKPPGDAGGDAGDDVITSYSIHYTKLYEIAIACSTQV